MLERVEFRHVQVWFANVGTVSMSAYAVRFANVGTSSTPFLILVLSIRQGQLCV